MSKKISKTEQRVVDAIVSQLESGTVPWRVPYLEASLPVSWVTQKPYKGINVILLGAGGEYLTYNQVKKAGGHVRKGEKGKPIVFWSPIRKRKEVIDEETGETSNVYTDMPILKVYTVFEVGQCEGISPKRETPANPNRDDSTTDDEKIQLAQALLEGYIEKPRYITRAGSGAYYVPAEDAIYMSGKKDYISDYHYYATMFHELVHSTGHASRLSRPGIINIEGMGSKSYSSEELIAEFGASMLSGYCGFYEEIGENSASYIQSWISRIKEEPDILMKSVRQSSQAVDFILKNNTHVLEETKGTEDKGNHEKVVQALRSGLYHTRMEFKSKIYRGVYVLGIEHTKYSGRLSKIADEYLSEVEGKVDDATLQPYVQEQVHQIQEELRYQLFEVFYRKVTETKDRKMSNYDIYRWAGKGELSEICKDVPTSELGNALFEEYYKVAPETSRDYPLTPKEQQRMARAVYMAQAISASEVSNLRMAVTKSSKGEHLIKVSPSKQGNSVVISYNGMYAVDSKGNTRTIYQRLLQEYSPMKEFESRNVQGLLKQLGYTPEEVQIISSLVLRGFDLRYQIN